jgi:hypothetical protein
MSEQEEPILNRVGPEAAVDSTPSSIRRRLTTLVRSVRSPRVRAVVAPTVGLAAPFVAVFVDAAEIPTWTTAVLAVLLAALFFLIERALSSAQPATVARFLWGALAVSLTLPVGAWAYHELVDVSAKRYTFYYNDEPMEFLFGVGMPGARVASDAPPLQSGNSYEFECRATDGDGIIWLRPTWQYGSGDSWYPAAPLTPVGDFTMFDLPGCRL